MGSFTELEAFVIYVLTRHKVIESSNIIWAGEVVVWGNDKCATSLG
jgi:hypothetical protein